MTNDLIGKWLKDMNSLLTEKNNMIKVELREQKLAEVSTLWSPQIIWLWKYHDPIHCHVR